MNLSDMVKIGLRKTVCINCLSEDDIRLLVDNLELELSDEEFSNIVTSSTGTTVEFKFGPDGSFQGVYAYLNGQPTILIPGTNSEAMAIFKGAPSATNPGEGWEVEVELTRKYLGQAQDENQWEVFFASRVSVLNNIGD